MNQTRSDRDEDSGFWFSMIILCMLGFIGCFLFGFVLFPVNPYGALIKFAVGIFLSWVAVKCGQRYCWSDSKKVKIS